MPVQDDDVALLQPVRLLGPVREEGLGEAERGHAQTPAQHEHVVVSTLGQRASTPEQLEDVFNFITSFFACSIHLSPARLPVSFAQKIRHFFSNMTQTIYSIVVFKNA